MNKTYLNFTDKLIAGIEVKENQKCVLYRDIRQKGLEIIVSRGGTRSFYFRSVFNKRRFFIKIGQFPYMNVDTARERAFLMLRDAKNGINPLAIKHNADITLKDFFNNEYIPNYAKKYKKSGYSEAQTGMFNYYLGALCDFRLTEISRDDIDAFHKKIGQNKGQYIANRCLALLRHILNIAIEFDYLESNPASRIRMYEEKARDRFLQPSEITKFMQAVNNCKNHQFRDFILLLLYTGQRKSNIASLKWSQIDFHNNTLYLPHTKNGQPQTIPLTNQALNLINQIKSNKKGKGDFIFPSDKSKSGYISGFKSGWKSILKNSGIENLRIHDLRRTMGSYQAITGASLNIIGKSLGHKSVSATMIYARLNLDSVRASMQKATDEMNKIYSNL